MKQAKVLNETEIKKLMKVCELTRYAERNRLIVSLSVLSGMRACEIANLRINNVLSDTNAVLDLIVLDKEQTKGNNINFQSIPPSLGVIDPKSVRYPQLLVEEPHH